MMDAFWSAIEQWIEDAGGEVIQGVEISQRGVIYIVIGLAALLAFGLFFSPLGRSMEFVWDNKGKIIAALLIIFVLVPVLITMA
jgi:uncharacterized membrane protein